MKGTKGFQLSVSIFLFAFLILLTAVQLSMADAIDQFDLPNLNKDLWEMMVVGKASYEIKDGILHMTSPNVESGIMLYYPKNIAGVDITIEIQLQPIIIADNVVTGFIGKLMEPQINTDINNQWLANFFFVASSWYIKQDPVVIGEKPPNPPDLTGQYKMEWNIVRIESSATKGKISFFLNGNAAGEVDMNKDVKERYFYISPDTYTSHYTGEVEIDYIKFTGPGAPNLAVEPAGKLSTVWGKIKNET